MKFATVTPRGLLTPLSEHLGDYHLILAHEVNMHRSYGAYYRGRRLALGDYIIMDHGIAEGVRTSQQALEAAYEEVRPNEIIAPDVLNDKHLTFDHTHAFLQHEWVKEARQQGTRIMVVPQGKDWPEWKLSLAELLGLKPNTVGISKFDADFIPGVGVSGRSNAVQHIREYIRNLYLPMPEIHLLGLYQSPIELAAVQVNVGTWVRGCDSTMPIAAAVEGTTFHPLYGALMRHPTWEYDTDLLLTARQTDLAITNIQLCQAWAAVGIVGALS